MTAPDAPPFETPWQAQLFALTVALNEAGHLPWADWTAAFSPRVRDSDAYWQAWAETLEALLAERGVANPARLTTLTARWETAMRTTPHGQPVTLDARPKERACPSH